MESGLLLGSAGPLRAGLVGAAEIRSSVCMRSHCLGYAVGSASGGLGRCRAVRGSEWDNAAFERGAHLCSFVEAVGEGASRFVTGSSLGLCGGRGRTGLNANAGEAGCSTGRSGMSHGTSCAGGVSNWSTSSSWSVKDGSWYLGKDVDSVCVPGTRFTHPWSGSSRRTAMGGSTSGW